MHDKTQPSELDEEWFINKCIVDGWGYNEDMLEYFLERVAFMMCSAHIAEDEARETAYMQFCDKQMVN